MYANVTLLDKDPFSLSSRLRDLEREFIKLKSKVERWKRSEE